MRREKKKIDVRKQREKKRERWVVDFGFKSWSFDKLFDDLSPPADKSEQFYILSRFIVSSSFFFK